MDSILQPLLGGGVTGAIVAFLLWYLNKKDKEHKLERDEYRADFKEALNRTITVIENNSRVLTDMERTLERAECRFNTNSRHYD